MDITKIKSALQSLKEERAYIEEYIQNAAVKKKELDEELNSSKLNTIVNCDFLLQRNKKEESQKILQDK